MVVELDYCLIIDEAYLFCGLSLEVTAQNDDHGRALDHFDDVVVAVGQAPAEERNDRQKLTQDPLDEVPVHFMLRAAVYGVSREARGALGNVPPNWCLVWGVIN